MVGADDIDYNVALLAKDGAATAVDFQAADAGTALGATTTVFELQNSITDGSAANLVEALGGTATDAAIDTNETFLIVNYIAGNQAQIWRFLGADNQDIAASELTLVATLTGVTANSLTNADFI